MSVDRDKVAELSVEDRDVLDMLMDCGFDESALPPMSDERRRRVEAVRNLFNLLGDYPVEDADDLLIDATMARIGRAEKPQRDAIPIDTARKEMQQAQRRRWRVPDLISVAAVVLILASIAIPVMSYVRQTMVDEGCANNLRALAHAFSQYANDYDGRMPVARAGIGSGWDSFSNSMNLKPLINHGYCEQGHLDCPGNHEHGGPSYSYQFQSPKITYIWGVANLGVVIADRNPLIDAARALRVPPPANASSINHGERGQNTLQGDGAVIFLVKPAFHRDNIWLPEGKSTLDEGDQPTSDHDIFLVH